MKYFYSSVLLFAFIFSSCDNTESFSDAFSKENKFSDKKFQEIYKCQDERNTQNLLEFLTDRKEVYQEAASIAFASVQDSNAIEKLLELLKNDESENVRIAAALAIGQTKYSKSEFALMNIYKNERSNNVKKIILEALGKVGTVKSLKFVNDLFIKTKIETIKQGVLWSIGRFAIRGISDSVLIVNLINRISEGTYSDSCEYIASVGLSRIRNLNFDTNVDNIKYLFKKSDNIYTKSNLCLSLVNANSINSFDFLDSISKSSADYRVKISAIRSLSRYTNNNVGETLIGLLSDSNTNIGITASQYFVSNGNFKKAESYFKLAKKLKNWRIRTNLLSASIKYSKNKKLISNAIISGYKVSENLYEKANLLKALGGDPSQYKFVSEEVFSTENVIISTYGMEALAEMRRNIDFEKYNEKSIRNHNIDLYKEFALIFKRAIISSDVAMITIAAEIIRDEKLNYINQYKNTYFLTQALNNCILPKEFEAYSELKKTIFYINGVEIEENPIFIEFKPDWKHITKIKKNQNVLIKSSRGDIKLELYVEKCPFTVSTFIKLIEEGFYKDKSIHRVVPNFVVQDGCPRGDGWGSPDFSIRSEFSNIYYEEGSIGMASSGKDTESSQWFITHSPTPHLDGRYTNFGKVVSGIEFIHEMEVGDKIIDIELIEEK